jgi:hydrazine synthase alpha subunit-like protein/WD40 repeat protein
MNREEQQVTRCLGTLVNQCRQMRSVNHSACTLPQAITLSLLLFSFGCSRAVPRGSFVFTQSPAKKSNPVSAVDALDLRYAIGSRVMLADSDFKHLEVLSEGLLSAGGPQVTCDGKRVVFCAKANPGADWQIYEAELGRRGYRPLTAAPGGAANPALLPDGRLLFVSPVAKLGVTNPAASVLYAQAPGESPKALTFTSMNVSDPTVLEDGRVLFVGTQPSETNHGAASCALYTINNDGTEITDFSRPQTRPAFIRRPRQVGGNRIFYLVSELGSDCGARSVEFIRSARPFAPPERLSLLDCNRFGSVQPAANGRLLVTAATSASAPAPHSLAIYGMDPEAENLGQALFSDPAWDSFEAAEVAPSPHPMGRLSTVDPTKQTGQILCLNVNYTTYDTNRSTAQATRVRVVAQPAAGKLRVLGEVPVQADGSFMAEVPADVPLGLEALDNQGQLLRRLSPMIWVRPGENRSCIGCHEPRNHAPTNHRPLAVRAAVPRLTLDKPSLAQAKR